MCLSGDIYDLNYEMMEIINHAISLYGKASDVIKNGTSRRFGPQVINYRQPRGWQAVMRENPDKSKIMVVVHTFGETHPDTIRLPLTPGLEYAVEWSFCLDHTEYEILDGILEIKIADEYEGAVIMLKIHN